MRSTPPDGKRLRRLFPWSLSAPSARPTRELFLISWTVLAGVVVVLASVRPFVATGLVAALVFVDLGAAVLRITRPAWSRGLERIRISGTFLLLLGMLLLAGPAAPVWLLTLPAVVRIASTPSDRLLRLGVGAGLTGIVIATLLAVPPGATLELWAAPPLVFLIVLGATRAFAIRERSRTVPAEAILKLSKTKADFLAVVNHEVRTPVHAMLAGLELLETALPKLDEEERRLFRILKKSGSHLRGQVNSLLDMSRFTHQKQSLRHERFDLRALVDELLAMYSLHLAEGVRLESYLEPDLPCHFNGDAARLQTILRNLLSNATKFTASGTVSLEVRWQSPERRSVRISVADTGPGIHPDDHNLIFEPFTQLPVPTARDHAGVGLGLALCGANVHLLGGTIELESEVGRGSRFSCVVPIEPCRQWVEEGARGASCRDCRVGVREALAPPELTSLAAVRVLIVEDDAVNRLVLEKLLRREGVGHIAVSESGSDAINRVRRDPFDVVLMDIHLPDLPGTEAARSLRREGWKGVLIAVTADTTPEMRSTVAAAGIDHLSPKPLDMQDLMTSIREGLGKGGPRPRKQEG